VCGWGKGKATLGSRRGERAFHKKKKIHGIWGRIKILVKEKEGRRGGVANAQNVKNFEKKRQRAELNQRGGKATVWLQAWPPHTTGKKGERVYGSKAGSQRGRKWEGGMETGHKKGGGGTSLPRGSLKFLGGAVRSKKTNYPTKKKKKTKPYLSIKGGEGEKKRIFPKQPVRERRKKQFLG